MRSAPGDRRRSGQEIGDRDLQGRVGWGDDDLPGRQDLGEAVDACHRITVDLQATVYQIQHPVLRNRGARVQRTLRAPIQIAGRVRDLDDESGLLGVRIPKVNRRAPALPTRPTQVM